MLLEALGFVSGGRQAAGYVHPAALLYSPWTSQLGVTIDFFQL